MAERWLQSVLVAAVFALGLLQGSRAALGRMPATPAPEPAAYAETPAPKPSEADALRGRFFRPAGSDAARPELRLRPSFWTPHAPARVALACPDPAC